MTDFDGATWNLAHDPVRTAKTPSPASRIKDFLDAWNQHQRPTTRDCEVVTTYSKRYLYALTEPDLRSVLEDLTVLARVGDLYLTSLDNDPTNEHLTLGEAMLDTEIREAVERAGYDVRWNEENSD